MTKKNKIIVSIIAFTLLVAVISTVGINKNSLQTSLVYTYGSRGDTVKTIQDKLKRWGYYNGSVDGIYGYQTIDAVKYFQGSNGLVSDGIAGKNTLEALGIFEKTTVSNGSNSNNDINNDTASNAETDLLLLARVINGEARGEVYTGQVAVGAVILNRVKNPNFPNSLYGVVYEKGAFDAVADGQVNLKPTDSSMKAAQDALNGWDPTNGAIYYWNPKTATNQWMLSMPVTTVIGNHAFGISK
jgi:N-acetylmuramoyl-L-alanine amidase